MKISRQKELISRMNEIETVECPGGPHDGCCEFCKGSCFTYKLDGISLNQEETDFVDSDPTFQIYGL